MLLFSNNASSTLHALLIAASTSLTIQDVDANEFPQPTAADDYFMLTIEDRTQNPPARELVRATARTGSVITIVRAQEGTTALAFSVGVTVSNRITAGSLNALASVAGTNQQLYLGPFSVAPMHTNSGGSLFAGLLYFNTTSNQLFEYGSEGWAALATGASSVSSGIYCGAFAVAPTARPDTTPLQAGDLYYNTTSGGAGGLFEYTAGAWAPATLSTTITGSTTVAGNLTVDGNLAVTGDTALTGGLSVAGETILTSLESNDGTFQSLTVVGLTSTGSLDIGGKPVVTAGDLSGTVNRQQWPNGNYEIWGSAATDNTGNGTIVFDTPFPNALINLQITITGTSMSGGGNGVTPYNRTSLGFAVRSGSSSGLYGPVAFDWVAKGN